MEIMQLLGGNQQAIPLHEQSLIGAARRAATRIALEAGAQDSHTARYALTVTELASNVIKHTKGGEILLQVLRQPGRLTLEALAIDRGPGMEDISKCLNDGYSTAGTSGTGLGAVARQSDEFDIFSSLKNGTAVMARVTARNHSENHDSHFRLGVVSKSYPGEPVCGDGWAFACNGRRCSAIVVDGLGHGIMAAEAAGKATAVHAEDPFQPPERLLKRASEQMVGTRGGALAAGLLEHDRAALRYSGLGNISGRIISSGHVRGLFSHNGTAGLPAQRFQEIEYPWQKDSLWIMHSDGLQSRWQLDAYPGLMRHHPAIIAAVLSRDFERGRDDVTVIVIAPSGQANGK